MPFTEWSNEFNVGIEEIDGEHRKLLELLNQLHDAAKTGDGREVLGRVLDGLMHYVDYHFTHEEEFFLRTNYPGYERHRRQHQALTVTVREIRDDFQLGGADALPQQVLDFLKNWLFEHILGSDRAFGVYFNAYQATLQAALESQAGRAAEAAPR
jgi:hemerythrin